MAIRKLMVFVLVMVIMLEGSRALSLCNVNDDGFLACKPSVTKEVPPVDPSPECCQALKGADLTCLCSYRNSLVLPSLGIDPDLALALPKKCNLSLPADC